VVVSDPLLLLTTWQAPGNQALLVRKALGAAVVFWPSGRRTLEGYYITAAVLARRGPMRDACEAATANLVVSAEDWRRRHHPPGWFIREDLRGHKRARRVRAVAWVHPDTVSARWAGVGSLVQ
jgi:hypothetical protein